VLQDFFVFFCCIKQADEQTKEKNITTFTRIYKGNNRMHITALARTRIGSTRAHSLLKQDILIHDEQTNEQMGHKRRTIVGLG